MPVHTDEDHPHGSAWSRRQLLQSSACRVAAVDTPESRTRRKEEKAAGLAVKAAVGRWLARYPELSCIKLDTRSKFAGRFIGTLFPPDDPAGNLTDWLLSNGLAREYGGGKKQRWRSRRLKQIMKRADALT